MSARTSTSFGLSPDGKRAVFGARGEIFTVPAKDGATRNLTQSSGVHERDADWSPDGKWISFISDASGEDEIYVDLTGRQGHAAAHHHGRRLLQVRASSGRPTVKS